MGWIVLSSSGLALGLLLYEILRRSTPANPDPTCGKCGYCVRGIMTLTCPECGSDLREVGIRPPRKKPPLARVRPFTAILIWTMLIVIPAAYFWHGYVRSYGPFHFTWRQYPTVISRSEFLNFSLLMRVEGESTESRRLTDYRPHRMLIAINSTRSHAGPLLLDIRAGTYDYADSPTTRVKGDGPLTVGAVREWLATHNYVIPPEARADTTITELVAIILALQNGDQDALATYLARGRPYAGGPARRGMLPPQWSTGSLALKLPGAVVTSEYALGAYLIFLALPLLLWLVGTLVILRRTRAQASTAPVPAAV